MTRTKPVRVRSPTSGPPFLQLRSEPPSCFMMRLRDVRGMNFLDGRLIMGPFKVARRHRSESEPESESDSPSRSASGIIRESESESLSGLTTRRDPELCKPF